MKKFILSGVSLVLMISCLILGVAANGPVVGAGTGTNYKVNDVEELAEVLNFLLAKNENGKNDLGIDTNGREISLVSANGEKYPVTPLASKKASKKYNSATISMLSSLSSSSYCSNPDYSNGVKNASQSLTREMTIYVSKDTSLYQTKGKFNSSRTVQKKERKENTTWIDGMPVVDYYYDTTEETYTTVMNFDMQLVRAGNDRAYVNFKDFWYSDSEKSRQLKYANANKWIEMPYEFVSELIDIDTMNRDVLKTFGDILQHLIDAGEIEPDETFIVLNEDAFVRAAEELENSPLSDMTLDEGSIEFSYDLTSPTTPYMSLMYYYDVDDSKEVNNGYNSTTYVSTSNELSMSEQYIIRNINNTVVPFDKDNVEIKVKGEKSFDKLFTIKERNRNDD